MGVVEKETETYWVRIYIAGPIDVAKQVIRRECAEEGLCVTVEPTHYIYTYGEETGYVVGFLNYPRFESTPEKIEQRAEKLLRTLLDETHQGSGLFMSPRRTKWISKRNDR